MGNSKSNRIIERRKNITQRLKGIFPNDIAHLISEYDYHFAEKSFILTRCAGSISCIATLPCGRIVTGRSCLTIAGWKTDTSIWDPNTGKRMNTVVIGPTHQIETIKTVNTELYG